MTIWLQILAHEYAVTHAALQNPDRGRLIADARGYTYLLRVARLQTLGFEYLGRRIRSVLDKATSVRRPLAITGRASVTTCPGIN